MRPIQTLFALLVLLPVGVAGAGELHLLGAVPYSYATDVSADGHIAIGHDGSGVWTWTYDTGVTFIPGALPPPNGVGGTPRISADGVTTLVSMLDSTTQKSEATRLDLLMMEPGEVPTWGYNCDIASTSGWAMSPDGTVVAGLGYQIGCAAHGFVWRVGDAALTQLPTAYFFKPTRVNAMSANGDVVAGWNDDYSGYRQGAVWTKNAAGSYIETLLVGTGNLKLREAGVVSANGQWVFGIGRSGLDGGAPYRWSAATGYQPIVPTPSADVGYVTDANADGSRLLCFFGMGGGAGYIWRAATGYTALADYAAEFGVAVPADVSLGLPLGMSDDGLSIVGTAFGSFGMSPFVLDLRGGTPPCAGDPNGDGVVDGLDMGLVLSAWASAEPSADLNLDGVVDGLDMSVILSGWGACP